MAYYCCGYSRSSSCRSHRRLYYAFYKKELKDSLLKEKVFTTNGAMNEILEDVYDMEKYKLENKQVIKINS